MPDFKIEDWVKLLQDVALPTIGQDGNIHAEGSAEFYAAMAALGYPANELTAPLDQRQPSEVIQVFDAAGEWAFHSFDLGVLVGFGLAQTWPESPEELSTWLQRAYAYVGLNEHGGYRIPDPEPP